MAMSAPTRVTAMIVALLWGAWPAAASAQDEVTRARAQAHVDLAMKFFTAKRYPAALEELDNANKLMPDPLYVYNMARCYEEMGQDGPALDKFEAFLKQTKDRKRAARAREAVGKLVDRLYGTLDIKCTTPGVRLRIAGIGEADCPLLRKRVKPGPYVVEAQAPKHGALKQTVKVRAGHVRRVAVSLVARPGRLHVASPSGTGQLSIDGRTIGWLPLDMLEVPAGEHTVKVLLVDHDPWSVRVVVPADEVVHLMAAPPARTGTLHAVSEPSGAEVFVDGKSVGKTPLTFPGVAPGARRVAVRLNGFKPWAKQLKVTKGGLLRVDPTLQPISGHLVVLSQPLKATVLLDGEKVGVTPLNLPITRIGKRKVKLILANHHGFETTTVVRAGRRSVVTAKLKTHSGALEVFASERGADVLINGRAMGRAPYKQAKALVGSYKIAVRKGGFLEWTDTATVRQGKVARVTAKLSPAPGFLDVKCSPKGVRVLVKGQPEAAAPAPTMTLPPGRYDVLCDGPRWRPWRGGAVVTTGKTTAVGQKLAPHVGLLSVSSTPAGGTVRIDGRVLGTTPLARLSVGVGDRVVEVRRQGYAVWTHPVTIQEGRESKLSSTLSRLPASLTVKSSPPGALVLIDGNEAGETPLTAKGLEPGIHEVRIHDFGHRDVLRRLDLGPGEEATVDAELPVQRGTLHVRSNPPQAQVLLDGRPVGRTPIDAIPVPLGSHTLVVDDVLHAAWAKELFVEDGETLSVEAELPGQALGWSLLAVSALAAGGAGWSLLEARDAADERDVAVAAYGDDSNTDEEFVHYREMGEDAGDRRDVMLATTGLLTFAALSAGAVSGYLLTRSGEARIQRTAATVFTGRGLLSTWRW